LPTLALHLGAIDGKAWVRVPGPLPGGCMVRPLVMVVEDGLVAQQRIGALLRGLDLKPRIMSSVRLSVAILDGLTKPFAAAFLDRRLPDGSGYDVLRKIRDTPIIASIPVAIVSADEERRSILPEPPSSRTQARIPGLDWYFVKPLTRENVRELLPWV